MAALETPKSQYAQIADQLRDRIAAGDYAPGSLMPSESQLAEQFNVTRVTINKAMQLLRTSGDVKVRRGAGTFVRELPPIIRDAKRRYAARTQGTGAGEVEVRKMNLNSRTAYGAIGRVPTPARIAATLGVKPGDDALLRPRVLYANDEPTQIANSYLPWKIAKKSPELLQEDAGKGGSYSRLGDIGYAPVRFSEDVTVRLPTDAEQRTLRLEATQPVFEIEHVAYSADDTVVEVCIHVMTGHLWQLRYEWDDET